MFAERRIPAEWETQDGIWLQWPLQFEHWMRPEMAATVSAIQNYESVHLIVQNQNHLNEAQNQIQDQGGNPDSVIYHIQAHNNAWLRDNGPVYLESDNQLIINKINNCFINSHYLYRDINKYIKKFQKQNSSPKIFISYEKDVLDTGGAIKNLDNVIMDEPLIVLNGDSIIFKTTSLNPLSVSKEKATPADAKSERTIFCTQTESPTSK